MSSPRPMLLPDVVRKKVASCRCTASLIYCHRHSVYEWCTILQCPECSTKVFACVGCAHLIFNKRRCGWKDNRSLKSHHASHHSQGDNWCKTGKELSSSKRKISDSESVDISPRRVSDLFASHNSPHFHGHEMDGNGLNYLIFRAQRKVEDDMYDSLPPIEPTHAQLQYDISLLCSGLAPEQMSTLAACFSGIAKISRSSPLGSEYLVPALPTTTSEL